MTERDGPDQTTDERFFREHSIQFASSVDELPSDVNWEQVSDGLPARIFLDHNPQIGSTLYDDCTRNYGSAFYAVPSSNPAYQDRSIQFYGVYGDRDVRLRKQSLESGVEVEILAHNETVLNAVLYVFGTIANGQVVQSVSDLPTEWACQYPEIGYSAAVDTITKVLGPNTHWGVMPISERSSEGSSRLIYNKVSLWTEPTTALERGRRTANGSWLRVIQGGK